MLRIAVATINGSVSPRLEGYLRIFAAISTDDGVHLPLGLPAAIATATATGTGAIAALGTPCLPTSGTALRLISIALLGMILLVIGAEHEGLSAILTG